MICLNKYKKLFSCPYRVNGMSREVLKTATVQFNYHVYLPEEKHYYSAPYRLKGKKVTVIYNDTSVEIYSQHLRVALHKRVHGALSRYSTIKEHMPPTHQYFSDWTPQRFISWAQKIGDYVTNVIEVILARPAHPEQSYKVCLGILNLGKTLLQRTTQ
jgi:hypothetical protein